VERVSSVTFGKDFPQNNAFSFSMTTLRTELRIFSTWHVGFDPVVDEVIV
jgi:hypothetical protein